jgi:hypothetical protein
MKSLLQTLLVVLALFGGVYKSFAPFIPGYLQVNILPAGAVAAGAQWEVDGTLPLRPSGTTASLFVCTHTVSFTDISGWTTPASFDVTVALGQTTITNGTYVATTALSLAVGLTPMNTVLVTWPSPSTGWNLQQNTNLPTTNWVAPPQIVNDDGTNKFIIVSPTSGKMFYRLKK